MFRSFKTEKRTKYYLCSSTISLLRESSSLMAEKSAARFTTLFWRGSKTEDNQETAVTIWWLTTTYSKLRVMSHHVWSNSKMSFCNSRNSRITLASWILGMYDSVKEKKQHSTNKWTRELLWWLCENYTGSQWRQSVGSREAQGSWHCTGKLTSQLVYIYRCKVRRGTVESSWILLTGTSALVSVRERYQYKCDLDVLTVNSVKRPIRKKGWQKRGSQLKVMRCIQVNTGNTHTHSELSHCTCEVDKMYKKNVKSSIEEKMATCCVERKGMTKQLQAKNKTKQNTQTGERQKNASQKYNKQNLTQNTEKW